MLSVRDWIWVAFIIGGIAFTNGVLSTRVTALESQIQDLNMLRLDARLSVIEDQLKRLNNKVDTLLNP